MNILSHRNNIVLFLACNMAAMQNLYTRIIFLLLYGSELIINVL